MVSVVSIDETESSQYCRETDDCVAIRRDCQTLEQWQSQLMRSLHDSGWSAGMMLYLPAPVPLHWILLLQHECTFTLINEQSVHTSMAGQICGTDRALWMALACRTLQHRGWSASMLSRAWGIPRTNIRRILEVELTEPAGFREKYGSGTEETQEDDDEGEV